MQRKALKLMIFFMWFWQILLHNVQRVFTNDFTDVSFIFRRLHLNLFNRPSLYALYWCLCLWRALLSSLWHREENDSDILLSCLQPTSQPITVWAAFRAPHPHSLSAAITVLVLDSGNLDPPRVFLQLAGDSPITSHYLKQPSEKRRGEEGVGGRTGRLMLVNQKRIQSWIRPERKEGNWRNQSFILYFILFIFLAFCWDWHCKRHKKSKV